MLDYLGDYGDSLIASFNTTETKVSLNEWIILRAKQRGYKILPVNFCLYCKGNNLVTNFQYNNIVCSDCGCESQTAKLVDTYTRTPTPYKRLTHFKDWLLKSQAKHTVEFDSKFLNDIKQAASCSIPRYYNIRTWLKRRGLFKHYENIALIQSLIGGEKFLFNLKPSEELLLYNYFNQITKVYNLYKIKSRKSFLSYSFIIRELIKLFFSKERASELNLDFFCLPKAEKVAEYNVVFTKIKKHYGWV